MPRLAPSLVDMAYKPHVKHVSMNPCLLERYNGYTWHTSPQQSQASKHIDTWRGRFPGNAHLPVRDGPAEEVAACQIPQSKMPGIA